MKRCIFTNSTVFQNVNKEKGKKKNSQKCKEDQLSIVMKTSQERKPLREEA